MDDVLAGDRLEMILPDCALPPVPVELRITPGRVIIARLKQLVEYLAEETLRTPGMEQLSSRS